MDLFLEYWVLGLGCQTKDTFWKVACINTLCGFLSLIKLINDKNTIENNYKKVYNIVTDWGEYFANWRWKNENVKNW